MKYIILSDSDNTANFIMPRQLIKINGEPLVSRTIRLLKENGIKDVIITSHDTRFDNLGATRYEPLHNDYKPKKRQGCWLSAFPIELLNEPITFLPGDVYYSEDAIKKIVNSETNSVLFCCTYKNTSKKYIKSWDEPLAFKVVDYNLFKEHIARVKELYKMGKCVRSPIAWELYRSLNGIDVNKHEVGDNCLIINDETTDIDRIEDVELLRKVIGGEKMIKCEVTEKFTLSRFEELSNIVRKNGGSRGALFVGDVFECNEEMADYLTGNNPTHRAVVKIIEVIPEEKEADTPKVEEIKEVEKVVSKLKSKKKKKAVKKGE